MSAIREAGFGGDGDTSAGTNKGFAKSSLASGGGGGEPVPEESKPGPQRENRGGGATVKMQNLVAAASAAAARPGVTREMIKGYDIFASGLG